MAEESVKVAIRVRPFNSREKEANAKLCVAMTGNQTICTNPQSKEEKKFAYDFSYWSFDGFKSDSAGNLVADSPKYADQKKVYGDLGEGVLKNSWAGYNASLFAYGQTGSGKSYSVVGYGPNKGIVPLVCEDIFKKAPTIKDKTIEVTFSMLEIYSETVRDLLTTSADRKQGLLIREDPKIGFYPTGLTKTLVSNYNDITKLTDQGTANRTIASTNMNATSSRAHTIVTVNLVQKYKNDAGKEMALSSLINLVDLAGSERADATGATGDRLKEGAAINLSLTSLGNVISALADNSNGKSVRVPYRDSVLTKLLMNALGGNSKTIMIAAISPADINFDETVSTLRYADRAKQIKCKAVINEDPTEKLIKDLKEENQRLKKMLESGKIDPALLESMKNGSSGGGSAADPKNDDAMKKMLDDNEKQMQAMQKTYEEKLSEAKNKPQSDREIILEKAKKIPHLTNINMDPSLSKTIKLLLEGDGKKTIGIPGSSDVGLNGVGIQNPHGSITVQGGKFTIEAENGGKILRNGRQVTTPVELAHLDRLLFGSSQYYIFIDPSKATPKDTDYQFEMMQDEIAKASGVARTSTQNWSPEEIKAQQEFLDLLPHVNEVNEISIEMDRKLKYSVLSVPPDICAAYDGKPQAYVSVKNFQFGLEWIWDKNKFMDRKVDMADYYLDFKDDGIINRDKFKNYDPFFESPDTPTQIGTAIISLKSVAFLLPYKSEFKILDMRSRQAGTVDVEIIPCDLNGNVLNDKDMKMIRNPDQELADKNISFILKISTAKISNPVYQDIFCEFQMYSDTINETPTKKLAPRAEMAKAGPGVNAKNPPANGQKPPHPDNNGKPPHPDNNGKPPHPDNNGKPPHPDNNGQPPHPDNKVHPDPNTKPPAPNPGPVPNPGPAPNPGLAPNSVPVTVQGIKIKTKMLPFKTEVIKGTSTPNFKFSQQFYYSVNQQFLDFMQNKSVYIKVFGTQKNANPNQTVASLSTKDYFDKKHEDAVNSISGKMPFKLIDPEIQKLRDELNFFKMKEKQSQQTLDRVVSLLESSNERAVDPDEWLQFFGGAVMNVVTTTTTTEANKSSSTCIII